MPDAFSLTLSTASRIDYDSYAPIDFRSGIDKGCHMQDMKGKVTAIVCPAFCLEPFAWNQTLGTAETYELLLSCITSQLFSSYRQSDHLQYSNRNSEGSQR